MTPREEKHLRILLRTRTIAMVGASLKSIRPSHGVGLYLVRAGYRVIPVNPGHAGETLFGETIVRSLKEIEEPVDLINIFRRSEDVLPVVTDAIDHLADLKAVWMQLGISNTEARVLAEAKGLDVVENLCIKDAHAHLIGTPKV
ncbi:MAG: CoA-binding protein [Boseongicola sp.]|nr:CoA-binding protein [Boseongicola sp.]MDD9978818.1 CoA-binding protein [Boseongicola sp.]